MILQRVSLLIVLALVASVCGVRDLSEICYRFTPCGMSGHRGPSLEQCNEFYSENNSPIARDNVLVGFEGYDGAQGFRVPRTGLYNVTVAGAAGGRGVCNVEVGHGVVQHFQVELSTYQELLVLVGQSGLGPCDTENPPPVCDNPPTLINETVECNTTWYESLISEGVDYGNFYYPFVGGGGGGGASIVRHKEVGGSFGDLATAISGGAGGSPAVLSYEVIQDIIFSTTLLSPTDEMLYHNFLDAKPSLFDEAISNLGGVRGLRNTSFNRFPNVNAGAGGGFFQHPDSPVTEIDGRLLGPAGSGFAEGGFDCATLLSSGGFFDRPLEEVYGGFGGGGGGCGGGGGGGGFTGGAIVQRGVDLPGGGGYSGFLNDSNDITVDPIGFALNVISADGFVNIVLADCGCAYKCDLDTQTEKFECLCPIETQQAPDQSDCFEAIELDVMQGPSTLTNLSNVEDLYVTPISFNEAAIFIFSISFTVSTVTQTATRQATSQDTCAVVFIGQDSEIVLTSNFVVDSGTVNSLAVITIPEEEQNIFFVSEYTQFLDSSILVTGGFLITTQPCIVEGMKIEVNASIRETDAESLNFQEILEIATNITSETARNILQLVSPSDSSPSTSDSSPITDSSPSYSERTLIIAVVVPVGVLGIATLILLVLLLRWRFQRKKSSMLPAPILESPGVSPTVFTSMILENAEALEHTSGAFNNHSYALLRYTENEYERQDPVRDKFASKYGVSAPFYDFTDYNRQRSGSLINDWEYPRSNLIFMRNLGEGQFGKVLLMKAKCIAGYQGYIPVAVKTLSSTDPEIVRIFMEEAELMKRFSHPNIVSLLGITSKDESEDSSPLLILEYMPHGDLQGFLKSHRPEEGEPSAIAEADLYNFAIDIARALEFLEMSKYVHRDVAARNCLVGSGLRIKMADFGMARGVYDKDYYRVAGRALLPVRWMAPECLLYGMFTSASDVWSYGVVLFEIMTYGKMPLEVMNMQNIVEEVQNGTLRHPRPKNCPDIIYDVMSECHNHEQDQRPTFTKILATLEKIRSDSCVSVGI